MENSQPSFNCDETPTPTRFIRNCEEVGLFQDLQNNPFEETFRIAVQTSSHTTTHSLPEPLSNSVEADTLDTPQVVPNSKRIEDYQHCYPIIEDDEDGIKLSNDCLIEYIFQGENVESNIIEKNSDETQLIQVINQNGYEINEQIPQVILPDVLPNDYRNNLETEKQDTEPEKNVIDLTLSPVQEQSLKFKTSPLQNKAVEEIFFENNEQSSANKSLTDEFFRILHDGKTETVTFPIQDVKHAQSPNSQTIVSNKNVLFIPSGSSSNLAHIGTIKISPKLEIPTEPTVKDRLKTLLKPNPENTIIQKINVITTNNQASQPVAINGEDKVVYFRERNRMAQKRCRLKKKKWITQLKRDTESVYDENKHLRSEIISLRAEIAHLKTLLLAHKNCPVTQAMYQADISNVVQKDTLPGCSRRPSAHGVISVPSATPISNGHGNLATGQTVRVISSNITQNKKLIMDSKRVSISRLNGTREKYRNSSQTDKNPPLKVFIGTEVKNKAKLLPVNSPNAVKVIRFNQNVSEVTDLTYDSS